jgi:AcrR family transcriptional regulator
MPRRPDPRLESAILDAAQELWKKGGEKALTMRAVARAAGTNTPAVYRRFRDRSDILRGLLSRIRLEIAAELEKGSTAEEACECYLNYAMRHPREYELFYQHNYELNYSARARGRRAEAIGRPARDVMTRKLQEKFGPSIDRHERLLMASWMLGHGAAMLLIAKSILPEEAVEAKTVFKTAVKVLLSEPVLGNSHIEKA